MASSWPLVTVFVTSYGKDFMKEREVILKEVIPSVRLWCEDNKVQLCIKDIRWGRETTEEKFIDALKDVEESLHSNVAPIFINISCDSLGIIPSWGNPPNVVLCEYQKKLKISDSEMEMLCSVQSPDNHNSVVLLRDDTFMHELLPEEQTFFTSLDLISTESREYTAELLLAYSTDRVLRYTYTTAGWDWEDDRISVRLSDHFVPQLSEMVLRCVQRQFPARGSPLSEVCAHTRDIHTAFLSSQSAKVRGRESVIQQVEDYVLSGSRDVPLLLLGGAGSGKTSVMAKAAQHLKHQVQGGKLKPVEDKTWHVFYHFAGAVCGSTDLTHMLKRLVVELEVVNESSMPRDHTALCQLSYSAMCNPSTQPVIILVDAVNQFEDESSATIMSWVPRKLAPQVRCILSMVNDTPHHQTFKDRESKAQELHLLPLDVHIREEIVCDLCDDFCLSDRAVDALLAKRSSENPLWLSIACEELRDCNTPSQIHSTIKRLPDGLLCLLEEVLSKFEEEKDGHLVSATLCLLEVSATGLLESELTQLLGAHNNTPLSPFDEKEERESSEKESKCVDKNGETTSISREKWTYVLKKLKPFLCPSGSTGQGKLQFYHKSLSKAVRRKLFKDYEENERCEDSEDLYRFWHHKLADFFQHCDDIGRKTQEYLPHLAQLSDEVRLAECLCNWDIFDRLHHDEYSSKLINYWRQAGGIEEMLSSYKRTLNELESQEQRNERQVAKRYENIARIFLQAGKYSSALELCKVALKWEEKELGNRDERMVELYSLMAEIYDEKLKLNDFVSRRQLPDLRRTMSCGRKSIELRKRLSGDYHKSKLGLSLMKLAFSLESWDACGGDSDLSGPEALTQGNTHIDSALKIFHEMNDMGHYAEALMTKGVLARRGTMEQLKYYNQAMEICKQVFGEYSLLSSRLYINIGIVHEDNSDYVKAYEYFERWAEVSDAVLGPDHPKTLRAKGVLREPRYRLVAQRLKERGRSHSNEWSEGEEGADDINEEVERLLDTGDTVTSNRDDTTPATTDVTQMNTELQEAINELLRRALGDMDTQTDLLHNILNSVNLPHPENNDSSNRDGHQGDDELRDELNEDNL